MSLTALSKKSDISSFVNISFLPVYPFYNKQKVAGFSVVLFICGFLRYI